MAAMTIQGAGGNPFSFLTALATKGGFLFHAPMVDEEILSTPGVDGRRWRTRFLQMGPAEITTSSDAASWSSAVFLAEDYRALKGSLVAVTWTAGGTAYTYKKAHVSEVDATPVAGTIVGGGASGSATAHVITKWVIEATDF